MLRKVIAYARKCWTAQVSNEAPIIITDLRKLVLEDISDLFSLQELKDNIKHECDRLTGLEKLRAQRSLAPLLEDEKELTQLYLGLLFDIMNHYNIKIKNKKCRALSPKVFQETFDDMTHRFRHSKDKPFSKYGLIENTNDTKVPAYIVINNIRTDFENRIGDFLLSL